MFCNKCGSQVADGTPFCTNCGAPMGAARPTQPPYQAGAYQPYSGAPTGGFNVGGVMGSMGLFKILVSVFAVLSILGTLLPCYTLFGHSVAYIEGDGVFIIIGAVAAMILAFLNKEKFSFIPTVLATFVLIYLTSQLADAPIGGFGFGFYLMWIGAIGTIASSVLSLVKNK